MLVEGLLNIQLKLRGFLYFLVFGAILLLLQKMFITMKFISKFAFSLFLIFIPVCHKKWCVWKSQQKKSDCPALATQFLFHILKILTEINIIM